MSCGVAIEFSESFPEVLSGGPFRGRANGGPREDVIRPSRSFVLGQGVEVVPKASIGLLGGESTWGFRRGGPTTMGSPPCRGQGTNGLMMDQASRYYGSMGERRRGENFTRRDGVSNSGEIRSYPWSLRAPTYGATRGGVLLLRFGTPSRRRGSYTFQGGIDLARLEGSPTKLQVST